MTTVIEARGLSKDYGPVRALQGLDLAIEEGEVFGFLGPNGAGKTTTIRLLTGFLRPTAGTALVLGRDAWREGVQVRDRLGFLPDYPAMEEHLTGNEVLELLGRLQGRPPVLRRELLERLELPQEALRRRVRGYSRGMRQKLGIVQALQHDPELIIMDEPTEGLDPLMQEEFFRIILECNRRGRTVFFSSHILPEVERLCRRVGIIRGGRLVALDTIEQLRRRKVRTMKVVLARGQTWPEAPLPGVADLRRDGRVVELRVHGDVNPVLRALAALELEDMEYQQASLEDIFLDFYQEHPAGAVSPVGEGGQ